MIKFDSVFILQPFMQPIKIITSTYSPHRILFWNCIFKQSNHIFTCNTKMFWGFSSTLTMFACALELIRPFDEYIYTHLEQWECLSALIPTTFTECICRQNGKDPLFNTRPNGNMFDDIKLFFQIAISGSCSSITHSFEHKQTRQRPFASHSSSSLK